VSESANERRLDPLVRQVPHIRCGDCGKLIPAERTNNGLADCWLGHCCGFGQAEYDIQAVEYLPNGELTGTEARKRKNET
jgi:hypothetical protein